MGLRLGKGLGLACITLHSITSLDCYFLWLAVRKSQDFYNKDAFHDKPFALEHKASEVVGCFTWQ